MNRPYVPQPILDAAHDRSAARAAQEWTRADELRDEIEAGGWRVIDSGTDFRLEPAVPADRVDSGRLLFGHSLAVPSRLDEPSTAPASVVVLLPHPGTPFEARTLDGLVAASPPGIHHVVVAEAPTPELSAALEAFAGAVEVVGTSTRIGAAALRNIGIRRATGEIVVLVDGLIDLLGDIVSPLIDALADPTVAVAGVDGLSTVDFSAFTPTGAGDAATAIGGPIIAFRRADAHAVGPIDEAFHTSELADTWWSLMLREGEAGSQVREAVVLPDLPIILRGSAVSGELVDREARAVRRERYRLLRRFAGHEDLLAGG
ncbi:MAG: glycosyltransferase family A protein [Chloroflexota bacterium]